MQKKVSTNIDRRDGRKSIFTQQFRSGVSMTEQLRKEKDKLFPKKKQTTN